jgi:hypothetical protein
MGFKTINGRKVFIDDNRRTKSNGRNDESEGMKIGNGTRVPKTVLLENRANVGIRAYTDQVSFEGVPVVFEISTHVVRGKYFIEPYWENQGTEPNPDLDLPEEGFDTFNDAVDYLEDKLGIKVELDRDRSNDHQTWEENIEQTDRILPIEKIFWQLPENQRGKIGSEGHESESIEDFLERKRLI